MMARRFAEQARAHDWFAVAVDLVVLILGVFIGLQVQDWNTEREARARGQRYSARLEADMRYEAWNYEYLIAYYKDVRSNAERAITALTDGPPLSDELLLISTYRASQYLLNESRRSTYDELVATGAIALIADARLREAAISQFNNPDILATAQAAMNSEYRRLFRRSLSADIQHALLADCGDRLAEPGDFVQIVGSINYPCTLHVPAAKIAAAAAKFRTDDKLLEALQLRFADLETAIFNLEYSNPVLLGNLRAITREAAP